MMNTMREEQDSILLEIDPDAYNKVIGQELMELLLSCSLQRGMVR